MEPGQDQQTSNEQTTNEQTPNEQTPNLDASVGYGRPPHHTRFRKGQSGNSKGRPRHARNTATLLARALDERVTVNENGQRRTLSKREAIIKQLVNRSAAADLKAIGMLMGLLQTLEPASRPLHAEQQETFAAADQQVLATVRERLARLGSRS